MSGVYLIYEKLPTTTEYVSPYPDPISINNITKEAFVDNREIPVPVGHITEYMGESIDDFEIPSIPISDGKRVLTSYKSGNDIKYTWEADKKILFKKFRAGFGTVAVDTRYTYCITDDYPEINSSTLVSLSVSTVAGSQVIDYSGILNWNFGVSNPTKVYINYTAKTAQANATCTILVTYYDTNY